MCPGRKEKEVRTMNVNLKLESAMCVGKKENMMQDGKTKYYNISVVKNGEACMLSCNEETYNKAKEFVKYDFLCQYRDGQYKGLRVIGAIELSDSFQSLTDTVTEKDAPNGGGSDSQSKPVKDKEDVSNGGGVGPQSTAAKKGK